MGPDKRFPLETVKQEDGDEEQMRDREILLWCVALLCGTALILCGMFTWVMSWFVE